MKILLLLLFTVAHLSAAPPLVNFAWNDPGPEETAIIAGYRAHIGEVSGTYTRVEELGTPDDFRATIEDLEFGKTYFLALTAYSGYGLESDYSTELTFTIPTRAPAAPGGLREQFTLNVQTSPDMKEWFHLASLTHEVSQPAEFFRIEFTLN